MSSKQAIPVDIDPQGITRAELPLTGDEYLHLVQEDPANPGTYNSRVAQASDIADLVPPPVAAVSFESDPTKPLLANFTLVNGGAGTATAATAKGIKITDTTGAAQIRFLKSNTAPDPANFTATFRVTRLRADSLGGNQAALVLRNSTNGRVIMWGDYQLNQWLIQNWTTLNGFSGNVLAAQTTEPASFPWRRVRRVGDALTFEISQDGENWGYLAATTVSGFLTATGGGNLDEIGIGVMGSGTSATLVGGTICQSFALT